MQFPDAGLSQITNPLSSAVFCSSNKSSLSLCVGCLEFNCCRSWKMFVAERKMKSLLSKKRCDHPLLELCHNCSLQNIMAMSNDLLKHRFHAYDIFKYLVLLYRYWWNTRIFPITKKSSSSRAVKILFLSFTCEDINVAMVTYMISQLQESFPLRRAADSFEISFTKWLL